MKWMLLRMWFKRKWNALLGRKTFVLGPMLAVLMLPAAAQLARPAAALADSEFVFVSGSEHHYLDPQRMSWMHDIRLAKLLFEGLHRIDARDVSLTPGVAERIEVSDDQLTYTFHLRPGAKWSNGDPVTAGHFVYAWRRAMMPDLAADYTQQFFHLKGAREFFDWRNQQLKTYRASRNVKTEQTARAALRAAYDKFDEMVGVEAVNDRTLRVTLKQPTPYFLQLTAFATFYPLHEPSVEKFTRLDVDTARVSQDPDFTDPGNYITNGPYYLTGRRFKRDVTLEKNPHYWNRANVGVDRIVQEIIESPENALRRYRQRRVHWLPDIPTASPLAARLVAQRRPDVHTTAAAGTYFYNFNCLPKLPDGSDNPLVDPRVRRALSMAIDREAIVKHVTRLNQPIARTFTPVGALPDYAPPVEAGLTYDPDAARKLLAEAGYPGGEGLEGLSILYNTGFGHDTIAQAIARNWSEQLGVEVSLEGVESRTFGQRLKTQKYVIARAGWFGDYLDPTTYLDKFRSGNGNNDAAWENERFDALMARADAETDAKKRFELLRQAEALMLQSQPIAPIFQYTNLNVFDPRRVRNLHLNAWNRYRLDQVEVVGR